MKSTFATVAATAMLTLSTASPVQREEGLGEHMLYCLPACAWPTTRDYILKAGCEDYDSTCICTPEFIEVHSVPFVKQLIEDCKGQASYPRLWDNLNDSCIMYPAKPEPTSTPEDATASTPKRDENKPAAAPSGAAHAQFWEEVPECARKCLKDAAVVVGCGDDPSCACNSEEAMADNAKDCVVDACGAATALNVLMPKLEQLCSQY